MGSPVEPTDRHGLLRQRVTEWKLRQREEARREYGSLAMLDFSEEEFARNDLERPAVRSQCMSGGPRHIRPCPWALCKFNMFGTLMTDATHLRKGPFGQNVIADSITSPLDLPPNLSCVLDMIEDQPFGYTLDRVGEILCLTRERVRQIQDASIRRVKRELALTSDGRGLIRTIEHLLSIEDEECIDIVTPDLSRPDIAG